MNKINVLPTVILLGITFSVLSAESTIDDNYDGYSFYSYPAPLALPIDSQLFEATGKELINSQEALDILKSIECRIISRRYNKETSMNIYDNMIIENLVYLIKKYPESRATLTAKLKLSDIYWGEILALKPLDEALCEINNDKTLNHKKKLKETLTNRIKEQIKTREIYYNVMMAIAESIKRHHKDKWEGILAYINSERYKNYDNASNEYFEFLSSYLSDANMEILDKISWEDPYCRFYFCEYIRRRDKISIGKDLLEAIFDFANKNNNSKLKIWAIDTLKKRYGVLPTPSD